MNDPTLEETVADYTAKLRGDTTSQALADVSQALNGLAKEAVAERMEDAKLLVILALVTLALSRREAVREGLRENAIRVVMEMVSGRILPAEAAVKLGESVNAEYALEERVKSESN